MTDEILQSEKIMKKYPDKIPVIVKKFKNTNLPDINKSKYIVPKDMNFTNFVYIIRKHIMSQLDNKSDWILNAEEAVYYGFADGVLGDRKFSTIDKLKNRKR